ncbi:MAG: RNA-binding protein [Christensenellales bacterium]
MKPPIQKGFVAISQKGRDKGRAFMVLYEMDAEFVMVANGDSRPVGHPKKKRRKHLVSTSRELPGILSLYEQGRLQDSDLRRALADSCPSIPDPAMKEGSVFVQK